MSFDLIIYTYHDVNHFFLHFFTVSQIIMIYIDMYIYIYINSVIVPRQKKYIHSKWVVKNLLSTTADIHYIYSTCLCIETNSKLFSFFFVFLFSTFHWNNTRRFFYFCLSLFHISLIHIFYSSIETNLKLFFSTSLPFTYN